MRMPVLVTLLSLALVGCAQADDVGTDPSAAPTPFTIESGQASSCAEGTTSCDDTGSSEVPGSEVLPVAGMCAEDAPDCVDTILPSGMSGDGAAGTCLEGATECADNPGGEAPGPPAPEQSTVVQPREGLVDVRSVPWASVVPVDDAQVTLEVAWWSGNQACNGLDRIEVAETAEVVTITVFAGRDPDTDICTEEALLVSTTVELDGELGPRSIVDGATR